MKHFVTFAYPRKGQEAETTPWNKSTFEVVPKPFRRLCWPLIHVAPNNGCYVCSHGRFFTEFSFY